MQDTLYDILFGALDRKWCVWYLWLEILLFIWGTIIFVGALFALIKTQNFTKTLPAFLYAFYVFLGYFVNRLLHTMCVRAIL